MADPECARGGGVSHILAEKGMLASLYSKKCIKMQYFHQKGGGVRRVRPMLDPPLTEMKATGVQLKSETYIEWSIAYYAICYMLINAYNAGIFLFKPRCFQYEIF